MTTVEDDVFGTIDGKEVKRFTLKREQLTAQVISYGATLTSLKIGETDILLGFDNIEGYTSSANPYMGAVVGRVANRIANGKFTLDGHEYKLAVNNGPNALHGGLKGLDKMLWKAKIGQGDGSVTFSYLSIDGEEGYPGDVVFNVRYSLEPGLGLKIEFSGMVTAATPVNLTNHAYFNLAGHAAGADGINEHVVRMTCDHFTPVSDTMIPTGEVKHVGGSVYDLRFPTRLGDVLPKCPGGDNNGFDHNFVVSGPREMNLVCRLEHPGTGIWLECHTDQPGCQFYTANFFPNDDSLKGKGGCVYKKHGGFCLETQKFPDSINQPDFPSCVIRPGQVYKHSVIYNVGKN